jgi:hypothetical protein
MRPSAPFPHSAGDHLKIRTPPYYSVLLAAHMRGARAAQLDDPPPLKWSDLRYVFDIKEDRNGKEAIQA